MHAQPSAQTVEPPRPGRRSLAPILLCSALSLSALGQGAGVAPAGSGALTDRQPKAEGADPARWAEAAAALLDAGDEQAIRSAVLAEGASAEMVVALAQVVAQREGPAPDAVYDALAERLGAASSQAEARALVAALARSSSKRAVQACIEALQAPSPILAAAEIFAALRTLTGRADLGDDVSAWATWWESARWLPEVEWRGRLARWRGERARRLEKERDDAYARLGALLREMHARLPEAERPERLAALLTDELPAVRRVGMDLAQRDLLNARAIPPGVVEAVAANLDQPDVGLRRAAAALLARLPNIDAFERIGAALLREQDPETAGSLLRAAARAPTAALCKVAADWLDRRASASSAGSAADLLLAASRQGALREPAVRRQVADSLRRTPVASLTPVEIELFLALGSAADRRNLLAAALEPASADPLSPEAQRALWAGLAARPDTAQRIVLGNVSPAPQAAVIQAAKSLGDAAAAQILLDKASAEQDAETAARWRAGAAQACLTLPLPAVRSLSAGVDDAFRVALLRAALEADPAVGQTPLLDLFADLVGSAVGSGETELARRGAEALGRMAAAGATLSSRAQAAALAALAAADRLKAAPALPADAATWLEALRLAQAGNWPGPARSRLAQVILARFSDALTPADAQWVRSLLAVEPDPAAPESGGDDGK